MPYRGVMRVALPVACKGKETGSDCAEAAGRMTSLTFSHTHQRKQESVYTEHIPPAHGSAKRGALHKVLVYSGPGLLNIRAGAKIRLFIRTQNSP